jgi:glycosyltransferase involved in cell wall biosynthesis
MMTDYPKVSVVIPAYNSADYTIETVESVLAQTYKNREIIVVDDGSTDHTYDELKRFGDEIKYIYKENGGACSARNLGIAMSTGEYVACLDCDDLWLPEKLEYSLFALEACPEASFVFTRCFLIDAGGAVSGEVGGICEAGQGAYKSILQGAAIPAPTVLIRKSYLDRVGVFDEQIFIPADRDLWLRLSRESTTCFVDRPLSKYRMSSNYTLKNLDQSLRENIYVLEKQFKAGNPLAPSLRRRILQENLFVHAMLYRSVENAANARKVLWRAFVVNPFSGRVLGNLIFSLFGIYLWNIAVKIRRHCMKSIESSNWQA